MKKSNYRWIVVVIFFLFMLLHQTDKLLINPMAGMIIEEWDLTDTQWGAIATAALITGAIFYPLWGYLYDRYARNKLLALASFIWGATTWLSAIVPTYKTFIATRASTGIDDSSYPGLYSLIADYFSPEVRGRIYGLLQVAMPLGYLIGLVLAMMVAPSIGWRNMFLITGGLGIILSFVIYFGIREIPRGKSEPELEKLTEIGIYRFEWSKVKDIFKKPSLILMYIQGFFGVFPWNTITAFIFLYLAEERGYSENQVLMTMAPTIIILALGYPFGGMLGDYFFKKTTRGRVLVAMVGVFIGAILIYITFGIPYDQTTIFTLMFMMTALFMPIAAPNVTSTVNDVTLPEIRSTAMSIQYFIESSGAALSPFITGIISDALKAANNPTPRGNAILIISVSTWILCGIFFFLTSRIIPKDIKCLRDEMKKRAEAGKIKAAT
jgi:MFS family permease